MFFYKYFDELLEQSQLQPAQWTVDMDPRKIELKRLNQDKQDLLKHLEKINERIHYLKTQLALAL